MTTRRHPRRKRNLWDHIENLPPVAVRLLARTEGHHPRPLTAMEICEASGLSLSDVRRLSEMVSWESVSVGVMRGFCRGCGVDFANSRQMERHLDYLDVYRRKQDRPPAFTYLCRSEDWPYYRKLLAIWNSL